MSRQATQVLKTNGLRKTQIRIDILESFLSSDQAYGQGDIEQLHPNKDRISIYRTLKTFADQGIIHHAVDVSGKVKYALCKDDCTTHGHLDQHAHFHCLDCQKTICLDSVAIPQVDLPKNYELKQSHLVLSGICEDCHSK